MFNLSFLGDFYFQFSRGRGLKVKITDGPTTKNGIKTQRLKVSTTSLSSSLTFIPFNIKVFRVIRRTLSRRKELCVVLRDNSSITPIMSTGVCIKDGEV